MEIHGSRIQNGDPETINVYMTIARKGEQSKEGTQHFQPLAEEDAGPVETENRHNMYVYSAPG